MLLDHGDEGLDPRVGVGGFYGKGTYLGEYRRVLQYAFAVPCHVAVLCCWAVLLLGSAAGG